MKKKRVNIQCGKSQSYCCIVFYFIDFGKKTIHSKVCQYFLLLLVFFILDSPLHLYISGWRSSRLLKGFRPNFSNCTIFVFCFGFNVDFGCALVHIHMQLYDFVSRPGSKPVGPMLFSPVRVRVLFATRKCQSSNPLCEKGNAKSRVLVSLFAELLLSAAAAGNGQTQSNQLDNQKKLTKMERNPHGSSNKSLARVERRHSPVQTRRDSVFLYNNYEWVGIWINLYHNSRRNQIDW